MMEPNDLVEQYERNLPTRSPCVPTPGITGDTLKEIKQLSDTEYGTMLDSLTVSDDIQSKVIAMRDEIRERKLKVLETSFDDLSYQRKIGRARQKVKAKKDIDNKTLNKKWKAKPWEFK